MLGSHRLWRLLFAAGLTTGLLSQQAGARIDAPIEQSCPDPGEVIVPRAKWFEATCLDDLTTNGNSRTDTGSTTGWGTQSSGALHSKYSNPPAKAVPGLQVDGYLDYSCSDFQTEPTTFMPACDNGFRQQGQFVIRVPTDWNGTLLVTGTPGIRDQFSSDFVFSDFAMKKGWAYVAGDKGNMSTDFYHEGADERDGDANPAAPHVPAEAIRKWHRNFRAVTILAKRFLAETYGRKPIHTYATGISNGGYQVRWALEHHPRLYDGGVDWEGTLFRAQGPNLFTYLPTLLKYYPEWKSGSEEAHEKMIEAGLKPGSEPIWDNHWTIYWGLTQKIYRAAIDPEYADDPPDQPPILVVPPTDRDADYDYHSRPDFVRKRMASISNTGDIGKPLITLHGNFDSLLPISTDSDVYSRLVKKHGRARIFRYYRVIGANHVDPQSDDKEGMRALLPCVRRALNLLVRWVERGGAPPRSHTIPYPKGATSEDLANTCNLRAGL
jgi:hypothetical protein